MPKPPPPLPEWFDLDQEYIYGIFNPEETRLLGGAGLHPRIGPGGLAIDYWIHAAKSMIWTLFADEYPVSAAVEMQTAAYDAAGGRLL